jgi:hypothetical protein
LDIDLGDNDSAVSFTVKNDESKSITSVDNVEAEQDDDKVNTG